MEVDWCYRAYSISNNEVHSRGPAFILVNAGYPNPTPSGRSCVRVNRTTARHIHTYLVSITRTHKMRNIRNTVQKNIRDNAFKSTPVSVSSYNQESQCRLTIIVYENESTLKAQMSSNAVSLGGIRKYDCKLIDPCTLFVEPCRVTSKCDQLKQWYKNKIFCICRVVPLASLARQACIFFSHCSLRESRNSSV